MPISDAISKSMPPIIYFNIGWMKDYKGAHANDPTIGGHGWLADHDHGLECFNFLSTKAGTVEGYRPPGVRDKVNIRRIGAKQGDSAIRGVLVVWLAREPGSRKTLVVGWYRNATVYREARIGHFNLHGMESEYSVTALKDEATLVPVGARVFQVQSSRTSPGKGFGQKPTWYGASEVDKCVWAYVNDWNNAKKRITPAKGKRAPRNADPQLRRKVEKAAVQHAWTYYETKYGVGCVESVEPYGCGWDLEVRCGDVEWLVEVKGLLNASLICELTPNEYSKMCSPKHRAKYVVYVLNNALAAKPAAPVASVFTWKAGRTWQTEDGRDLNVVERVGAVLTCK